VSAEVTRSTAYDAEKFGNNHPPGIEHHYWHHARNGVLYRKLRAHVSPDDVFLDVGCGPGVVVAYLRSRGYQAFGVDLGAPPVVVPAARGRVYLGQSASSLSHELRQSVTVLLLMDVLEHLERPDDLLDDCFRSFPRVRCLYVTLPARNEIWSNYDEYYGHFRRYTIESARQLSIPNGFCFVDSGYFFHGLYWAARITRLLTNDRDVVVRTPRIRPLHRALGVAFGVEERLLPKRSPGTSLYAVIRRVR
jgi:SAM-dependent methyltransferase